MRQKSVKLEVEYVSKQFNLGWFGKVTKYVTRSYLVPHDSMEDLKRGLNSMVSEGKVVWYDLSEEYDESEFETLLNETNTLMTPRHCDV